MDLCAPRSRALFYRAAMKIRFPRMSNGRICGCTDIAGTNTPSQHAWGNAVDMVPPDKAYGDKVYAWVLKNRSTLRVHTACWYRQGGCTSPHLDHIHADFDPQMHGIPPCMGGPSVPDEKLPCPPALLTECGALLKRLGQKSFTDPRFQRGGKCYPCIDKSLANKIDDVVHGPLEALAFFTSGHNWLRLGEMLSGGILVLVALSFTARTFGAPVPGIVQNIPGVPTVVRRRAEKRTERRTEQEHQVRVRRTEQASHARQAGSERARAEAFDRETRRVYEENPELKQAVENQNGHDLSQTYVTPQGRVVQQRRRS